MRAILLVSISESLTIVKCLMRALIMHAGYDVPTFFPLPLLNLSPEHIFS